MQNWESRPLTASSRNSILCVAIACIVLWTSGCRTSPRSPSRARKVVAADLARRTGLNVRLAPAPRNANPSVPSGALSETQAVELALARNATFQERLIELNLAWADLVQAGILPNPDLQVLFPLGPKAAEATLAVPLEFVWLRGRRVASARAASDRSSALLVQAGLDLVRDVRFAYADLALARRRLALMNEAAKLRERVAELAAARVRAGESAPLDSVTARADAVRSHQEAARLVHDAAIAEERLRALLGAGADRAPLELVADDTPDAAPHDSGWTSADVDALITTAAARPDARAAELAVDAAEDRAKLARTEWFTFSGVADYNQRGSDGAEAGPGMKLALPLFNQNQGTIARADADLERARRQQQTLRDRIILEVRESYARVEQARQDLAAWRTQIRPAMEEAVTLSERAYRAGETPLLQVLDANRQLLDAQVREAQVASELRRARAELERSVGRRLDLAEKQQ